MLSNLTFFNLQFCFSAKSEALVIHDLQCRFCTEKEEWDLTMISVHVFYNMPMQCKIVPVLESLPVLLLLPVLSPLVRTEIPLKLLALVTAGFKLRRELSESVLLQGRGSEYFNSLSVLL